jgi:hypothetical protein
MVCEDVHVYLPITDDIAIDNLTCTRFCACRSCPRNILSMHASAARKEHNITYLIDQWASDRLLLRGDIYRERGHQV